MERRSNWLVAVGATLFAVVVAELILRGLAAYGSPGTLADLSTQKPAPGIKASLAAILRPSSARRQVYEMHPDLDVSFLEASLHTNALGWRDHDLPEKRVDGETRVLGIGDSFMFGWKVEEDQRYMDILEVELEKRTHRPWTTFTLAVPGYNLAMEVEALQRFGEDYDPDVILYGFVENDFCLPNFVMPRRGFFESGLELGRLLREGLRVKRQLLDRRLLLRSASDKEGRQQFATIEEFRSVYCDPNNVLAPYRDLVGEASFRTAFERMVQFARDHHAKLVVVDHSATDVALLKELLEDGKSGSYFDMEAPLEKLARERGFASLRESDLVFGLEDQHPSAPAHQVIGSLLADRLVQMKIGARKSGS